MLATNGLAFSWNDLQLMNGRLANSRAKRTIFERIIFSLQTSIMISSNSGNSTEKSPVSCRNDSYIQHAHLRSLTAHNRRADVVLVLLFSRQEKQTKDSLLLPLFQHLPLLLHHPNTSAVLRSAALPTFRLPISRRWRSRFETCCG